MGIRRRLSRGLQQVSNGSLDDDDFSSPLVPVVQQIAMGGPWPAGPRSNVIGSMTAIGQFIDEVWCGGVRPWGVTGQQQGPLGWSFAVFEL